MNPTEVSLVVPFDRVKFSKIYEGSYFSYNSEVYLKIVNPNKAEGNAISLTKKGREGHLANFLGDDMCVPVKNAYFHL